MPIVFPLSGLPKKFIPTAPNHFVETVVDEIIDYVLFVELESPESSYPGIIATNSFVNEFEPETAIRLIDNFHKTKRKRRRVQYFKEVYCRNKILRDFIELKPTCFLIMGAPCKKYYEIGEAFAERMSHVHVNVLDLINDEIARETDVGKWIYTNLKTGKDIPVQLVLQLLMKVLRRPDITYRGYVLTSFPIIPFKRFTQQRLPVRYSLLEELIAPPIDQCRKWLGRRARIIKCPGGDFEDSSFKVFGDGDGVNEEGSEEVSFRSSWSYGSDHDDQIQNEEVGMHEADNETGSVDSEGTQFDPELDSCLHEIINNPRLHNQLDEADVVSCVRNQFNTLLKLDLAPDIVVYVRHDENDRHLCSGAASKHIVSDMEEAAAEATLSIDRENMVINEGVSNESPPFSLGTSSSSTSTSFSEDYTDDIFEGPGIGLDDDETPLYMKRFISIKNEMEQFILHYSKDMVIKIDNRYSTKEILEQLNVRTKFMNIKCINEAVPLFPDGISKTLQQELSRLHTIGEQLDCICRIDPVMATLVWKKSSFMAKCPVKLYQGKIIQGKILFAVRFLGYIHLLSSFSAMKKFIRDPCKYFVCKPNCRVAIVGPRISSITSVMKSILNCVDYDWKLHLDREVYCEDIYREATEWADQAMQNIDVKSLGNEHFFKARSLSNVLEGCRTATERLLSLLSDELSIEEDVNPSEIFNDIELNSGDPDLMELLRSVFNDKEHSSQTPQALKASLKAVNEMSFEEIFNTLVEEKFNEIFKARHSEKMAREISQWIKQKDLEVSIKTNHNQKYAKWLIHDAPADLNFWKYLAKCGTLPDVVILFKPRASFCLFDLFSKQKGQLIDVHHIASYIINNFPVLFHEAECLLKKMETERLSEPSPFDPIEEIFRTIEVGVGGDHSTSLEELENYLTSQRVITIAQDMRENDSTTSNVAVVQKYFEIFKTKPMVQLEDDIQRLRKANAEFERQRIIVGMSRAPDYSECFDLDLQQAQFRHPSSVDADHELEADEGEVLDLAEVSQRNHQNIEMRTHFQHLQYGNTRRYCPVVYLDHNSLLYGLPQYSVEYSNRLYMMSSPKAREQFLKRPFEYAHDCLELTPPPFRCCIAGPNVVNRHIYASLLATQRKVATASILTLLREYIENRDLMDEWIRTSYDDIYEKHSEDFLANHVLPRFKEGFILEGFPTTSKEFTDMLRSHLCPEAIIIVDGRQGDIAQNLYSRDKHVWEQKLIWLVKAHRRHAGTEAMEKFEVEEILDFTSHYFESKSPYSDSNGSFDASILLSDEERERIFAEMQAKARKRVKGHIEGIKNVAKLATEHNIPVVQVPFVITRKKGNRLKDALESISPDKFKKTLFDYVSVVSLEMAENLLATGMCFYSHFKNFDPVDAYNLIPVNMHETMRKRKQLYACMYRSLIYFLNGPESLAAFCNNPKVFAKGDYPFSVVQPVRMGILGPPYSGISTLCSRIADEFNMKVFTKEDLISIIQTQFPCSNLARNHPDTIPFNKLFVESMHVFRNCSSNGFILDNHQMDPADIVNIAKHDVALHLVMLVDSEFSTVWRNWKAEHVRLRIQTFTNIMRELYNLYQVFRKHKKMVRAFMEDVRDIRLFNTVVVNKTNSKWEQWEEARSQIYISLREIGGYFKNLGIRECFSLSHMNIFWDEFQKRLSPVKTFCPVCLRLERKLTQFRYEYVPVGLDFYRNKCQQQFNEPFGYNLESLYEQYVFPKWYEWQTGKKPLVTNNAFRENLIQFREHFYWSCDRHRFDLMLHTEEYLPPDYYYLPLYVPFLVTNYFHLSVQFDGKCVVTCYTTRTIVEGSEAYAIFYRGKIYLCATAECALAFLQHPEVFYNFTGFEDQDSNADWDVREMTIDNGLLTPDLLVEALIALAKERPKHYGLSIADSAAIFVGLYLKCANPNNSVDTARLYQAAMSNYLHDCGLIRSKLAKYQMAGNPYIRRSSKEGTSRMV